MVGHFGHAQTTPEAPAVTAPIPGAPAPSPEPAAAAPTPAPQPAAAPPTPVAAPAQPATPATPETTVALPAEPPLPTARPDEKSQKQAVLAARDLFSKTALPSLGKAVSIGYYPRGCLQGGVELPPNGETWQVMRLSRNRNWGHPSLINFLEKFAPRAAKATGWHGILVGDLSQPRGGPTPFGHTSHQTGLDVDIWFMPMPDRRLSDEEREKLSASNLVGEDWKSLNPKTWTPEHIKFTKTAAMQPDVERVLVNAVIKREVCRVERKNGASWMSKVRPWYGHHDHIHVRLKCPADSPNCRKQPEVPASDGCDDKDLAFWFSDKVLAPKKPVFRPVKPLSMADLPPACQTVLNAPAASAPSASLR
jgi:penicillin-insensitive murein endopeptidase